MTTTDPTSVSWIKHIRWDSKGLVPVIAQEQGSGDVLMFAWMNREALQKTAELGQAVYFSRSRNKLWYKGEESGQGSAYDSCPPFEIRIRNRRPRAGPAE